MSESIRLAAWRWAIIVGVIAIAESAVRLGWISSFFLAAPSRAVLVLWEQGQAGPLLRIWCDGTFGPYLWETLLDIAREEGGRAVGLRKLFPEAGSLANL